jgi:hypothetical protein
MRRTLLALTVVLAVGMTASAALASSAHFKKGGEPVCTWSGTTSIPVTCTGTLAGLGNADLVTHLSVSGFALYQCQNGGGNTAPGQNRVLEGPATSNTLHPGSEIKNGNLAFSAGPATLTAAPTVSGATAGCPNPNWTGVNPVLTLTSITLDIYQPGAINPDGSISGTLIFHCTAANANGLTSPVTLTCTSP